jgi:hypothetical protein
MADSKGINNKIQDLENSKNFDELIKKQQELFKILFNKVAQIESDMILNGIGDYHELHWTDAHNSLKESIREEGRGHSRNTKK